MPLWSLEAKLSAKRNNKNKLKFDNEFKTKLDFTKHIQAVVELLSLKVLLLDEVSMIDDACFSGICNVLSIIDHTRRPNAWTADCFGPVHVLLFGGSRVSLFIK